jgi:hypothetical protein
MMACCEGKNKRISTAMTSTTNVKCNSIEREQCML